jgi:predicted amidohydrolase
MKICLAQTRSYKGDLKKNIAKHKKMIDLAILTKANLIVFPELSLTNYEPDLAKELALEVENQFFDEFQNISDSSQLSIALGYPLKTERGICIGMLIFRPSQTRLGYQKKYLHADEEQFFVSGINTFDTWGEKPKIALAICYELSVPAHSENAYAQNADIYLVSVAKTALGVEKSSEILANIAQKYQMQVLMVNGIGPCDNFESAGQSTVWNKKGEKLAQLDSDTEGILLFDTINESVEIITL